MDHERRAVAVLASQRFGADGAGPLGCERLAQHGWHIVHDDGWHDWYTDAGRVRRAVRSVERRTVPFVQFLRARRQARMQGARHALAFFESEAHAWALVRSLIPRRLRSGALVVLSCWLSDLVAQPRRRLLYRWLYRGVDHVTVFAESQVGVVQHALRLPAERVSVLTLGVESAPFVVPAPPPSQRSGGVLAVGRDAGRDWATFFAAAALGGWHATAITRSELVGEAAVPATVTVSNPVPRAEYVEHIKAARIVVVPSHERTYPTGQTVLLEAMMAGCAVVATGTAALADYLRPDETCLVVPPSDAKALSDAVTRLIADHALADRLGAAAQREARERFTADRMWADVSALLDRPRRGSR